MAVNTIKIVLIDDDAMRQEHEGYDLFVRLCAAANANATLESPVRIALDCEGVNLSRAGTVEIVSLCFDNQVSLVGTEKDDGELMAVFLVDFGRTSDADLLLQRVNILKQLLESDTIQKIIHDSRMDCDALFHLHDITPTNLHDTSCYHDVLTHQQDKNLNDVLDYYGLPQNAHRDKGVYKNNPRFWSTRPMTKRMLDWASSDISKLHLLARCQRDRMSTSQQARGATKSHALSSSARVMQLERGLRVTVPMGRFIGRGGSNIRSLQNATGTLIYGDFEKGGMMVFYGNEAALRRVKAAMTGG